MGVSEKAVVGKGASVLMAGASRDVKNSALAEIAEGLKASSGQIVAANEKDLAEAQKRGLGGALLKRLGFGEDKISEVREGIDSLIRLDDPVGKRIGAMELDEGLNLYKVSCPIGVIGVVFESRPDALVQISTLCLKSGNAVLLKGGSEAENTNRVLAEVIAAAGEKAGLPTGWLQLLETRDDVAEMLKLDEYVDLIVPRGSNEFVHYIMDNTNIAVLGHADGICHVYVDGEADLEMALKITVDSKCQYVAVCNAAETLVVDEKMGKDFLAKVKTALEAKGVEIRGCERTRAIVDVKAATEDDWSTEYLDLILSVKVVGGPAEAIEHINRYGSGHTDAIVTGNEKTAAKFMNLVDSADVFWNCSTRFSDGFRYGLGAEVGISTNKIHARGPVGLEGLVIYKYKLFGAGQIVADYCGPNARKFKHRKIGDGT
jgi:glutamate-5-semialdehyde dehydrogenase